MKIPLRPKKFAFRRFNYEKKVTSGVQKKILVPYFPWSIKAFNYM
jgi:hypothetical protein